MQKAMETKMKECTREELIKELRGVKFDINSKRKWAWICHCQITGFTKKDAVWYINTSPLDQLNERRKEWIKIEGN